MNTSFSCAVICKEAFSVGANPVLGPLKFAQHIALTRPQGLPISPSLALM